MVKKIKRSRSSKIEIMSMYGEEPTFADFDDLSEDEQKVRYGKAMYWYHGDYSSKDSKSVIVDYVKKNRKKEVGQGLVRKNRKKGVGQGWIEVNQHNCRFEFYSSMSYIMNALEQVHHRHCRQNVQVPL